MTISGWSLASPSLLQLANVLSGVHGRWLCWRAGHCSGTELIYPERRKSAKINMVREQKKLS